MIKKSSLFTHFLRGYFDFKGSANKYWIRLQGKNSLLDVIQNKYLKSIEHNRNIQKHNILSISGQNNVYDFMHIVYNSEVNPLRYIDNSKYKTYLSLKNNREE